MGNAILNPSIVGRWSPFMMPGALAESWKQLGYSEDHKSGYNIRKSYEL